MLVKICGIKEEETLLCCEKNRVNFFGMIFFDKSPRNISFKIAERLQKASDKLNINGVGVFVNKDLFELTELIKRLKIKFVQLHGDEDGNYIKEIKKLDVKVIKKISIRNNYDIKKVEIFNNVDYFLFDYKPKKDELPGGNAKVFDWDILKDLKTNKPWFLSGGVNLDNIKYIRTKINPFGVDLSSGIEKELGIKDNHIINNFIEKIKNA